MATNHPQSGILVPPPPAARYLEFAAQPGATKASAAAALKRLLAGDARIDGSSCVVGLGLSLVRLLDLDVPGLRAFPTLTGAGIDVPSTPQALWVWVRGEDRGEILHRARAVEAALATTFLLASSIDAFVYDGGRDLTGYEDGTENPKGEDAASVAIVADPCAAPPGSSFVAVQRWQHDLDRFAAMPRTRRDHVIGRERLTNEELADAPQSAHVKRTAQESFDPPAFMVRRSMPWAEDDSAGLVFVAFGATFDAYERALRRMVGLDDGILDGLFQFSTALSGAFYWCPPVSGGRLAIDLPD